MPRKPRQIVAGEYYHVFNRGDHRQFLYQEDCDFEFYLAKLRYYLTKYDVSCFHYCLMTNHFHFLLRSHHDDQGITKMMHDLQMVYAQYYQKRFSQTGHVFEDRFKDLWIDSDAYLLECGRYIERNPVRANIVDHPKDYPWSSHSYYADQKPHPVLTPNPLYLEMGRTPEERQRCYRKYLETPRPYEEVLDQFFKKPKAMELPV